MALPKAGLLKPPALIRLAQRQKVQRSATSTRVPSCASPSPKPHMKALGERRRLQRQGPGVAAVPGHRVRR